MRQLQKNPYRASERTLRHEMKRFVYLCDGLQRNSHRCTSTQVVDAATEAEADQIAKMRGWRLETAGFICNDREHRKWTARKTA